MRWCPACGRPKELHDREELVLPTGTVPFRACVVVESTSDYERKDGVTVWHADRDEMNRRMVAHEELRSA